MRRSRAAAIGRTAALLLGVSGLVAAVAGWVIRVPVSPPLVHEAYVWQRSWNDALAGAVTDAGAGLSGLLCLAGEITSPSGDLRFRRIAVDHNALRGSVGRPTAVVRIFPSVAADGWTAEARALCDESIREIVSEWSREHPGGIGLQIDYDCPESSLADFHAQMIRWRALHPGVVITFTALPTWLRKAAFAHLVRDFPDYVLQVHSLHLPRTSNAWVGLCDPREMREATLAAAELGVPFRVALPTYSCLVVFDRDGGIAEVYGEDIPEALPVGALDAVALDSDAHLLSSFVREWNRARPEPMRGNVWYRLPAPGDRLNWDWPLLARVIGGAPLHRGWSLRAEPDPAGYHRIVLENGGDAPDDLPARVRLRVPGARSVGSDGVAGYVSPSLPGPERGSHAVFEWHLAEPLRQFQKPPGWSGVVGWCRWQGGSAPPVTEFPPF